MDKTLLDTDIFSEILKGKNRQVAKRATAYRQNFGRYTISTITVMEIVKGFHKINRKDKVQKFLSNLSAVEVLTLDVRASTLAGRIIADLERIGRPIGRADCMIAAIALRYDLTLVTGNWSHYQRIQTLGYPRDSRIVRFAIKVVVLKIRLKSLIGNGEQGTGNGFGPFLLFPVPRSPFPFVIVV